MKQRIYGETVSINTNHVKDFYNKRASMISEQGWGAVSLGANDPTIADRVYNYDHDILFPKLNITPETRVLEIGCGMGRWANIILPHCRAYCGVDFSEDMLKAAKQVCHDRLDRGTFYHMSASTAVKTEPDFFGGAFGSILFSGVCMYINDEDLQEIFAQLPQLCQKNCTICIRETAALAERLTLNEFPSKELNTSYNAIYRSPHEYNQLFKPLIDVGFSIVEQDFLPASLGRKRKETNSWCTILKR